jgi:RNA polymerase sigma-B factor
MMRFYGNMTRDQIGQELGISQMHVSRLLSRALKYLRDRITGMDGPASEAGQERQGAIKRECDGRQPHPPRRRRGCRRYSDSGCS